MSKQNQTQDSNEYGKHGFPNECACDQSLAIRTENYKVEQLDQNFAQRNTFNSHYKHSWYGEDNQISLLPYRNLDYAA